MIDKDTIPLPERLERLRQWRDATAFDGAELILDRELISHMLDLIDDRPTYTPKTTPTNREELRHNIGWLAGVPRSVAERVKAVLDDLEAAEAALNAR